MAEVIIQGLPIKYRDLREGEEVLYAELSQDEQYFRTEVNPFSEEELIDIAAVEYELRKGVYSTEKRLWVEREEKRMTYGEGVYAMINGVQTYIPASYYGYVNHWYLEHGEKPDYREADRVFFLFMEYIYFETQVLCITRGKGRRQGATSLGFFWMWWICGRVEEKRGGSISYNDTAAQKNFQGMFMRGFKGMLPCFVRDFDSKAENFVRFVKPPEKAAKGVIQKRQGLNSYCDFLSATLNAYDSGRLSFGLFDEGGKQEKMDINTYWSKVSPTLKTGRKKVGMAYMPTTVNPKEKGGENYKKFWKEADQNAINPLTKEPYGFNTPHKVVRYFVPATEGYAGCIDKFGASVVEDPIAPVMGNDGEWITEGSKSVILKERALKKDEQLMEHQRDFPLDEFDMFAFESGNCEFNKEMIIAQIKLLEQEPVFLRKVRLIETATKLKEDYPGQGNRLKREVHWMDDESGGWLLLEEPRVKNKFTLHNGTVIPNNTLEYCIGVDTFRIGYAEDGSQGAICVLDKINMRPVAIWSGRTRLVQHLYDEIIKACLLYGCKCNIEISAGDHYLGYFHQHDCTELLYWTPALDPHKRNPVLKPGTESASPYELAAQLEAAKKFFDGDNPLVYNGYCHKVMFPTLLQQALNYVHAERTPYDLMVALMMALLPALHVSSFYVPPELKPKTLLPTFKIDNYN